MTKSINEWVQEVHAEAIIKGWWDGEILNPLEKQMLMVSEISEACEEVRIGTPPVYVKNNGICPIEVLEFNSFIMTNGDDVSYMKPEGELIELADLVIRVMDYCGRKGWDLEGAINVKHSFNKTRPHRHGGKLY